MKLTERQQVIMDILLQDVDQLGPGSAEVMAIKIDQAIPSLPAPATGHLPAAPLTQGRWAPPLAIQFVVDLDNFYEDVVMPSRERYMARNEGRRAGDASTP